MKHDLKVSLLHSSNFVKPIYQVALMIGTLSLLLSLAYVRMRQFRAVDPIPGLSTLHHTGNNKMATIDGGLYVRNFLQFNVVANEFLLDAYVWFEYETDKFKPEEINDFSFGKGVVEFKSKPYIHTMGNRTFVGYDIKVKFESNLNYRYFPIDSHAIYLTLNNLSISSERALFNISPTTFIVSDTLYTKGWKNIDNKVQSGFKTLILDKNDTRRKISFPRTLFIIDFLNTSFRTFLFIILPLFVIFFISLFTLSLDPRRYYTAILSVAAATMTALVSYRFVIDTMSPAVSYFMLGDHLFDLILILNFMIFLASTVLLNKLGKYRGGLVILFHAVLIIAWVYLLFVWAR